MADGFLQRYNEELRRCAAALRGLPMPFRRLPARLRMTAEVADDPHVERLIQSFAYSAARVRQKLDDEFPELTDGLLETLYPHYLAPIPSMSIVRFSPSETLASVQTVPRHTEILAEPVARRNLPVPHNTTGRRCAGRDQGCDPFRSADPGTALALCRCCRRACRISIEPQDGRKLSRNRSGAVALSHCLAHGGRRVLFMSCSSTIRLASRLRITATTRTRFFCRRPAFALSASIPKRRCCPTRQQALPVIAC